jgi:hypothetical protein
MLYPQTFYLRTVVHSPVLPEQRDETVNVCYFLHTVFYCYYTGVQNNGILGTYTVNTTLLLQLVKLHQSLQKPLLIHKH